METKIETSRLYEGKESRKLRQETAFLFFWKKHLIYHVSKKEKQRKKKRKKRKKKEKKENDKNKEIEQH